MSNNHDNGRAAPVPYRPPPHKQVKAGCWSTALLILLSLALLGCGLADAVQKVAEPIDTAGCKADCRIVGLCMSRYVYSNDECWCALLDGGEVKAHEFPVKLKGEYQ